MGKENRSCTNLVAFAAATANIIALELDFDGDSLGLLAAFLVALADNLALIATCAGA